MVKNEDKLYNFISEEQGYNFEIRNCDVYSDVMTNGKRLFVKSPVNGRIELRNALSSVLVLDLRNKIRLASDAGITEYDIDKMYEEVLSENEKYYIYKSGSTIRVLIPGEPSIPRSIYTKDGKKLYARLVRGDMTFTEVRQVDARLFEVIED